MKEKLGILLMEEEDGNINVQLFESPENARGVLDNLLGHPKDPPRRATLFSVDYEGKSVEVLLKTCQRN